MAELQFVRSFLGSLDGRPIKLPADYAEDAKSYPSRPPYILPRMTKPMQKPAGHKVAPGQEPAATVSVKSLHRGAPTLDVPVGAGVPLPLATTSVLDVRQALAGQTGIPLEKLKLLHNKKPVPDSKTLKDLVAGSSSDGSVTALELGVMVVGGAATVAAAETAKTTTAPEKAAETAETAETTTASTAPTAPTGLAVVESEAFWNDLRTFLVGRIHDDKQADEVFSLFARAWEERMI